MMYSIDFRIKVLKLKAEEGFTYEETAKRFGIAKTTLVRWHRRLEPLLSRNKPATSIDMELWKQDVEKYPDSYQYERAERFKVSQMCIYYALKRLGVTYKKTLNHPKANPERRSIFCQQIEGLKKEKIPLVFIDESGFVHDMPRTHGYSLKGSKCYGVQDWGAKGRTNAIGALCQGILLTVTLLTGSVKEVVPNDWTVWQQN